LIQNAIDASQDGNEVYLRAYQEENSLVLEVEDHGPGIPDEVMKRIFEPFYTTKTHGTGLGLSIVHRIMDVHGKKFELFTKPGEGTRVRLLL
jgi:signal transduction histidine kinase